VAVSIHHGTATDSTVGSTATVADPAVIVLGGYSLSATEGSDSGSRTLATFTDPGGSELASDYSASVNWGDGSPASVGAISYDLSSGTFTVSGNHTYADEGSYAIKVIVHHDTAPDSTAFSSASVIDAALAASGHNLMVTQGVSTGTVVVATFIDLGGPEPVTAYSASINWGDGSPSSSGVIAYDAVNQVFTVSGSHTYSGQANNTGLVTISHGTSTGASAVFTASVNSTGITLSGANVTATAGAPFTGEVGSFKGGSPGSPAGAFHAVINWGDGTLSSAGVITLSAGVFHISGNHTYAEPGKYAISVTVTDSFGNTTTAGSKAVVADLGKGIQHDQTEETGWWNNRRGQALINAFNGGPSSTALAMWLATNFRNLYGASAGTHSLIHANGSYFSNAEVANAYQRLFVETGAKLNAELLATALSIYATTSSLGGGVGAQFDFRVSAVGLGAYSFNIGCAGAFFGVANNTRLNVYEMLQAVNRRTICGNPYSGDRLSQLIVALVFDHLNEQGDD
jgi:hypothetical protein